MVFQTLVIDLWLVVFQLSRDAIGYDKVCKAILVY